MLAYAGRLLSAFAMAVLCAVFLDGAAQAAPLETLDPVASDPQLVLIGTGDWTPYVQQARHDAGPLGRLISGVFGRGGYRVQFLFYPWARDTYLLEKQQLDAVMPYLCIPERQRFSLCSDSMFDSNLAIFHRRDKAFDWRDLQDLEPYSIALTKGYAYGQAFDQARAAGRFKIVDDSREDAGMRLLLVGRADIHLQDRAVGYAILRRDFTAEQQQQLTAHPRILSRNPLGLLLVKTARGEQLRQVFNAGLQQLRANGELQRLQQALEAGTADNWQPRF